MDVTDGDTGERRALVFRLVTGGNSPLSEAQRITVGAPGMGGAVRFDTVESSRLADAVSIKEDLEFARAAFAALLDDVRYPPDSVLARSLFVAGLISYARCFNGGVRDSYRLEKLLVEALGTDASERHRWLIDTRSKFAAHSVNGYEQVCPGVVLSRVETGTRRVVGWTCLHSVLAIPPKEETQEAVAFIERVRSLVESDVASLGDALVSAAEAVPLDDLYKLSPLSNEMITADKTSQRRQRRGRVGPSSHG
jgi:hypothetical protein